ncbi:LysR family transcriptional regulator [Sphingomonas sp.]|uniref:LysR family transcriptional regulator n=1 Tax=Sphingomonas sp. TaxID=28214 RepID=UPI0038A7E457
MLDWNDLRYFLAVAREGSTLAAGRALRVSQTTVARRIAALEQALGIKLFDKRQAGYALTPEGQDLLSRAVQVGAVVDDFTRAASSHARELRGTVKITTEEVYGLTLVASVLTELHDLHPDIMIELDTAGTVRDLGAGEADIALRATKIGAEQPAGLVGRQLCFDDWAPYCSRAYAERRGVPRAVSELKDHAFIGGGGGNLWLQYQAWLQQLGLESQVAMHHATSGGLLAGVRSGFGIAVLPCAVADADPELIQCLPPRSKHERGLWLFTHERVRHTPRVRTVVDFLWDRLSRHIRQLEAKQAAA